MRITSLKVDGFGVWNDLSLAELSDELNVFYGPNEAGKTTLMQFVRSVLYGFSSDRRARYLPPVRGGRPGGSLAIETEHGPYTVVRHADDTIDAATVVDERDVVHDPRALASLLGDVDEPTFSNVFAFGLHEIQELGTLSDTQAADELYKLAIGLDRVSLADVLSELDSSRNRLLAPDDRPSLVTQLLSQRERLQGEMHDLAHSTPRYLALVSERQSLDSEVGRLESQAAELEKLARELALARALAPRWQRRAAVDAQLQTLQGFPALGPGALGRFDRLTARLTARRRRLGRFREARSKLIRQIEQLAINEPLVHAAPRLEALAEQQPWLESLERQLAELEAERTALVAQRGGDAVPSAQQPTAPGKPLTHRALVELRSAAKRLGQSKRDLRQFRQQMANSNETAAELEQKIDKALGDSKGKGLTDALAEAGELVAQLRRRVQLDERLDQMSRRQSELEEQGHEQLDKQLLSPWVLAALGCLFVLGCAMVLLYLAGLVLPASLTASLGWPVGLLGVLAAAAAGGVKFGMEHGATTRLTTCQQQAQLLGEQIEQAKAERDNLDERLPRGGGPLVSRLQAAEKQLASLEALVPLRSQHETAEHDAQIAANQQQTLARECRAAHKDWLRLLAQHNLPRQLRPRELRAFARRQQETTDLELAIAEKTQHLANRRGELAAVTARISQLTAEVGIAPQADRPLDVLRRTLVELRDHQARLKNRVELERQIAQVRARRGRVKQKVDALSNRRKLLLRAAGTDDELEFRRRAQAQADGERLRLERDELARELSAALTGQPEDRLVDWLAGRRNLEQADAELVDSRRETAAQLNGSLTRRGEMNEQLKLLVDDRQLAHKRIELGIVEKRLHDALERWRVLAVCGMMLEAVRQYYEREHQPQALSEASGYLSKLTLGRYTRVWTPLGERSLRVDDRDGHTLGVDKLSRGTREQLFLALRLALLHSFARRGVSLPLVLDDVLVNFDVVRAKAAATVLRDFARHGNQVLVFTCHEHIAKLFKQLKAEVRQLPDNSDPQVSEEPAPPRRVARRRPEVPVEPEPEPAVEVEHEPEPPFIPHFEEVVFEAPEIERPIIAPPPVVKAAPPPAAVAPPPPPKPAPRPARRVAKSVEHIVERVPWNAEEFDGELADRVRRPRVVEVETIEGESRAASDDDDAEAA